MVAKYAEITIRPHHAGFGMWERHPNAPEEYCEDLYDLLEGIRSVIELEDARLYELGVDELPAGVEDIRERIYGEPTYVYAVVWQDERGVEYFGIEKIEEEE